MLAEYSELIWICVAIYLYIMGFIVTASYAILSITRDNEIYAAQRKVAWFRVFLWPIQFSQKNLLKLSGIVLKGDTLKDK